MKNQRMIKMSECKYCGGDCPEQVNKNGEPREEFICNDYAVNTMAVRECAITTIFKGEYIQVDMVDETIELTVENNVYSHSESIELLAELQNACTVSRKASSMSKMGYIPPKKEW